MIYKAVRDFLIQLQEFWQAWSFAVSAVFPASFLHSADILPVRMMGFFEDHLDILLAAGDFEQSSPPKVSQTDTVCMYGLLHGCNLSCMLVHILQHHCRRQKA